MNTFFRLVRLGTQLQTSLLRAAHRKELRTASKATVARRRHALVAKSKVHYGVSHSEGMVQQIAHSAPPCY